MAQTKVNFTQPTTVYHPQLGQISLPAGEQFLGEGWSTTPPAPAPSPNANAPANNQAGSITGLTPIDQTFTTGNTPMGVNDIISQYNASGYNSNLLPDEVTAYKTAEETRLASRKEAINKAYQLAGQRIEELGKREEGGIKAGSHIMGGSGQTGLGMDSALTANVAMLRKEVAKELTDLEARKEEAILNADEASAQRIDQQIQYYTDRRDTLRQQELDNRLKLLTAWQTQKESETTQKQNAITTDINIMNALSDIPSDQTVTIGGKQYQGMATTDPFFKSSDLISLAKELQVGQSQTITDPNTGETYTIEGLSQPSADTQLFESTDSAGNVTYTTLDKNTGKIISTVSAGQIGKKDKTDSYVGVLASLPTSIQNRVISLATNFGSSDIVKKYNATVDGINLINGISETTTNPADHQTIVYAFAKSLDPESVVREGEYATIKKYAQSAIDKYGKEISNAIAGTGFLSKNAITNIKATMNNNYNSRKPAYDSLYEQQRGIINNIAGSNVADEIMVDYSQTATSPTADMDEAFGNVDWSSLDPNNF